MNSINSLKELNRRAHLLARKALRTLSLVTILTLRFSTRKPKIVLSLTAFILLISIFSASRIKMLLTMDDLIEPGYKTYQSLTTLNDNFQDQNNLFVIISNGKSSERANLSLDQLCQIKSWIHKTGTERTDILRINSTFGARKALDLEHSLQMPTLLQLPCDNLASVTDSQIQNQLLEIKNSPWGPLLTDRSAKDIAINFYLANSEEQSQSGKLDMKTVRELIDSLQNNILNKNPNLQADWSGVGIFKLCLKEGYDQTGLLNLVMVFFILIIFRIFYGTFKSGGLFLLSILIAAIPVYGAMAWFGHPLDVLTNNLSLMLVISTIEDFIFVSFLRIQNTSFSSRSWRRSFRQIIVPGFFTSLTTVIGFGSLAASDLGIIKNFGIWAATSAGLEWISVFIILPSLMTVFPNLRQWTDPKKAKGFQLNERLAKLKLARPLALILLSVYLITPVGAHRLTISDAPPNVFPKDHPMRISLRNIEDSRGWQTYVSLILTNFEDRTNNEKILNQISSNHLISSIESPYKIKDYLSNQVRPEKKILVESLWEKSSDADRFIKNGFARAILYMRDTDIVQINQFRKEIERICPNNECDIAGTLVSYGEFGEKVLTTLLDSFIISLLLVTICLLFLLYAFDIKEKFKILLAALWGPVAIIAIFIIFKIPLFYVTSVFASILVGLAGDNPIQYIFASQKSKMGAGIQKLGSASVQVILFMCLISCVLFFSYFAGVRDLAALMILGFGLGLFGDLWLLKALLK